jgi:hypothetical protein
VQKIINPYICYTFAFGISLCTYTLGWSDLYPELSFSLLIFLIATMAVQPVLAFCLRNNTVAFRVINAGDRPPVLITVFIYFLWICEFVYAGGIPLLKILLNQPYDYKAFGIPSLHVFIVTFSSFYTVHLFHLYLSQKRKKLFFLFCLNLAAAIIIYNRGMFMFNLFSALFLYLTYKNSFSPKEIMLGVAASILLLFVFGSMGSLRVSRAASTAYSNEDFLKTGSATESFKSSSIPSEFFWSYIYITSPLANLQNNINTFPVEPITGTRIIEYINNELLMDFMSKRINNKLNLEREKENTIPGPFNVSTVYSRCYSYAGWFGMILMAGLLCVIPLIYFKMLPTNSPFFLSGFSILCTLYLFLAFDNMLRFTGLSFQLVYPLLLHYVFKKWPGLKNLSVNNKVTTM